MEAALVRHHADALAGPHTEMVPAGADQIVGPEAAEGDVLAAVRTVLLGLTLVSLDRSRSPSALLQLISWFEKVNQCHTLTCSP